MEFRILRAYKDIVTSPKRYNILMGGRGAGRSYFASQYSLACLKDLKNFRGAIMRFLLSDIRNSIFQEIVDRIEEADVQDEFDIKEHSLQIGYGNNFLRGVGFRKSSSDNKSKLKSLANFNFIVIEEADEVSEEDFIQLDDSIRTVGADIKIFMMLNPPHRKHWIVKRWFNLEESKADGFYKARLKESEAHNTAFVHSTYRDNYLNLNATTIDNFQRYKETRPEHYFNMIEGLVSDGVRGRIYKNWQTISDAEYEKLDYPVYYGLDFGFTNDPTALIEIKTHNNEVYAKELIYETGLINARIGERMTQLGIKKNKEIIADSAEPKSVMELQLYGWNVIPSEKGPGSRKAGVDILLGKNVHYTESSKNLSNESQGYCWALDRNKEPTNEPQDGNDHLLDALRMAVFTKSRIPYVGF